ncbi:MAG: phage portal protein [Spirochaetia bacterium]|nr:phage portal protein [Spirochaetia bacterium]
MGKFNFFKRNKNKGLVSAEDLQKLSQPFESMDYSTVKPDKNHVWVNVAIEVQMRCVMRAEYQLYKNGKISETPFTHLFDSTGNNIPSPTLFMKSLMWWGWEGEFFWYWGGDYTYGPPKSIEVLDPRKVYTSKKDGTLKFYFHNSKGEMVPLLPGEFLHVKRPNIYNPDRGVFPLFSVGNIILAQDKLINQGNYENLQNGVIPDVVIKSKLRLTQPQAEEMSAIWEKVYGNSSRKRRAAVLGNGTDVTPLNNDLIKYVDLLDWNRGAILATYGVPLKVANAETAKTALSGKDSNEQYIALWSQTVLPTLSFFEGEINRQLFTATGYPQIRGEFNIDKVPELQEDENKVHERDNKDIVTGVVTINEIRARRGLNPVEWGDKPPDMRKSNSKGENNVDGENAQTQGE